MISQIIKLRFRDALKLNLCIVIVYHIYNLYDAWMYELYMYYLDINQHCIETDLSN